MKHLIYTLIAVFILSSCTISIDLTVNPDNSGTYAIGVQYSDSLRTIMGDPSETNKKLESEIMSDEMKEKYPSSIELPELVETDSSASLVFKFSNIEELNQIFMVMQDGPEAHQSLINKGKKYTYNFSNPESKKEDKDEENSDVIDESSFLEEVKFQYTMTFPERKIVKIKKIEEYQISEDGSMMIYQVPIKKVEKDPITIQMKVK